MNRQEKRDTTYFTILVFYTFLAAALGAFIIVNGAEKNMLLQLGAKLVICWIIHFIRKIPEKVEKWVGFVCVIHGLVIFGINTVNLKSLTFVTLGLCLVYLVFELYELVHLTAAVYILTLAGNLMFFAGKNMKFTSSVIVTIVTQCAFVLFASYFAKKLKSQRKESKRLNKEIISRLEEENHRTENFLTNVSHELRTPINAVTGLTTVMLKNEEDGSKRENLYSIQKAGYRLFGQIEDILDYTEIDTDKIIANNEQYMLSSLINDIISERIMNDDKDNLELIFDVEAKIPAVLVGDSKKIKKIIKHLVNNAVKFTEEGGVYVRIYAIPKSYGINLCIQVTDTGIGMDAQSLARITERFYQSSSGNKRKAGGLGLGLPIVYGMTAAMEGFVHIESKVGEGTSVMVSIPQEIADDAPGMKVENPSKLCIACYLMPEKYKVTQIRKFYDKMISNLAVGLDVAVHRVFSLDELEMLVSTYNLTHLLLSDEEYEKDAEYFENLNKETQVIVVAKNSYRPKNNSRVKILRKPFFCFPVVNILNSEPSLAEQGKQMVCPDVKTLIVDDEPMNRMVAEGILKDYQMTVKTAGSGPEAIEICANEEFDLLFIDHMMPEMDGVEVLKQLRRLNTDSAQSFAAIAFTANAVSGAREMFLREGFDDFLSKPVDANELERVLRKVLPKSRIQFVDAKEIGNDSSDDNIGAGEKPDELTLLKNAGINTVEAMEYCRNDRKFYIQLLQKFVSDHENKTNDLNGFLDKEDYANYRIQVHSLKSSSKMMGADGLSQFAKEMESASKDNNAAYIKENHAKLMELYSETVRQIREAIGAESEEDESEEEISSAAEITLEELLNYIAELKGYFETYEADKSQHLLEELSKTTCKGQSVKKLLREIQHDVEEFEYDSALEKATALSEKLKGGEM